MRLFDVQELLKYVAVVVTGEKISFFLLSVNSDNALIEDYNI